MGKTPKKKPRKIGRPTELTPEMHNAIVDLVLKGNYGEVAAQACGIDERTYYNWMQWGDEGKDPYLHFFQDIKKAKAQSQAKCVEILTSLHTEEWQSLAWYLERTDHRRFGRKQDDESKKAKLEHAKLEEEIALLKAKRAELEHNASGTQEPINVVVRTFAKEEPEE